MLFVLIIIALTFFLLIVPIVVIYKLLLKKVKYFYSFLLLFYPFFIHYAGQYLRHKGSALNLADLNARMAAGEDAHILSIDAGLNYSFFGYVFYILVIPIGFVCIFFIIKRVFTKLGWF